MASPAARGPRFEVTDRLLRMLRELQAGRGANSSARPAASSTIAGAQAVVDQAEDLLVRVYRARLALSAAQDHRDVDEAERLVHLSMMEALERGLLATLEDVTKELKTLRGDPDGQAWLRRRLEGLGA